MKLFPGVEFQIPYNEKTYLVLHKPESDQCLLFCQTDLFSHFQEKFQQEDPTEEPTNEEILIHTLEYIESRAHLFILPQPLIQTLQSLNDLTEDQLLKIPDYQALYKFFLEELSPFFDAMLAGELDLCLTQQKSTPLYLPSLTSTLQAIDSLPDSYAINDQNMLFGINHKHELIYHLSVFDSLDQSSITAISCTLRSDGYCVVGEPEPHSKHLLRWNLGDATPYQTAPSNLLP